jgi:hypothetical protein
LNHHTRAIVAAKELDQGKALLLFRLVARRGQFDSTELSCAVRHFVCGSVFSPQLELYWRQLGGFAGTLMCRVRILILTVVLTIASWSNSEAAGSFQTKAAFQTVVTAGIAPAVPAIALPSVSAGDLVGGCGRGRIRDSQTHACRGPADIR